MDLDYSHTQLEKSEKIKHSFFAFLPGALSWGIILGFGICSFMRPVWALLILIVFDFYWVLFLLHTLILFWGTKIHLKNKNAPRDLEKGDVYHAVFIPVGDESAENLQVRLESLRQQKADHEQILVFFALSEHASANLKKMVWDFHRDPENQFLAGYIFPCESPSSGTCSMGADLNATLRLASHVFKLKGIPEENILVTCLGPESSFDPAFLSTLTDAFIDCPDRHRRGFRPKIQFPRNFWGDKEHSPVWNFGSSLLMVFDRIHSYNPGSFCRQSLSFSTLKKVGFWPEGFQSVDSALYWKAFLHFSGKYQIVSLKVAQRLVADSTSSGGKGLRKTCSRNFAWAAGMENLPVLMRLLKPQTRLPFPLRIWLFGRLIVQQVSISIWAVFFVVLGWLPGVAAAMGLYSSVAYYLAPEILLALGLFSSISFLLTFILCCGLLPKPEQKYSFAFWCKKIIAGFLLPIVLPWCSCVPLLVTQTRLMFGRTRSRDS